MSFNTFREFEASLQASRERRKKPNVNKNVLKKFIMSTESHNRNQEEQEMWMRHFASKEAVNSSPFSDKEHSRRKVKKRKRSKTKRKIAKGCADAEDSQSARRRRVSSESSSSISLAAGYKNVGAKRRRKKRKNDKAKCSELSDKKKRASSEPSSSTSSSAGYRNGLAKRKRERKSDRRRCSVSPDKVEDLLMTSSLSDVPLKSFSKRKKYRKKSSVNKKQKQRKDSAISSSSLDEYDTRKRRAKYIKAEKRSVKRHVKHYSDPTSSSEEDIKRKKTRQIRTKKCREHESSDSESSYSSNDRFVVTSAVDPPAVRENSKWDHDGYRKLYGNSNEPKGGCEQLNNFNSNRHKKYKGNTEISDSECSVGPTERDYLESKNLRWGHDGYRELYGDGDAWKSRRRQRPNQNMHGRQKETRSRCSDTDSNPDRDSSPEPRRHDSSPRHFYEESWQSRGVKNHSQKRHSIGKSKALSSKRRTTQPEGSRKQQVTDSSDSSAYSCDSSTTSDTCSNTRLTETSRKKKKKGKLEWVEKELLK